MDLILPTPDTFHFLRPGWLWALAALPLLWALWRWQHRRASPWAGVVDDVLQAHVLEAREGRGPRIPWRWLLVFALGVLALAGPAWRALPTPVVQSTDALVVVVDLSSSSRAADVAPDRITRARLKLARLIERRDGGLLGLAVFAGTPHTVSPLTADGSTLRQLVDALDPGLMPVDGHRPGAAIRHAHDLLRNAGHENGRILVMTDRADREARSAATEARAQGVTVSVLGLGHVDGAPVRDEAGGFERAAGGDVRVARLDPGSLRELAQVGGGSFRPIEAGDGDLEALGVLDTAGGAAAAEGVLLARHQDEGVWLLLPMLVLMLPGFRRGSLAVLALGLGLGVPSAQAADLDTLWQRPDQRAFQALSERDYERARALARDPMIRGTAAYRLGDYDQAAAAFGEADHADGDYNRGNALAGARRHEEAMAAWNDALMRDPDHADARANLEAMQQWLEQQPPEPEAEDSDGESGDGEGEDEAGSDDRQADDGEPESDPSGTPDTEPGTDESGEASPGDQGAEPTAGPRDEEAEADAEQALRDAIAEALAARADDDVETVQEPLDAEAVEAQERDEAIERWLRLVEDDPGALLRRKFMIEHQRRLRGEDRP